MNGAMTTKKSTDKPTRKARLAGFLAVAMLAAGCSKPVDDRASEAPKEAAPASEKETNATASVQAKASPESEWLAADLAYRCVGAACAFETLGARNKEEADWLRANGYPSSEQLKHFKGLSDDQLRLEADAGDLAAMVSFGERMAAAGDTKTGTQYVHDAIRNGSIYGYYGMSSIFQNTPGLEDMIDSAAYLRVAYILGDTKASVEMHRRYPDLGRIDQVHIDERAMSLYRTMAKSGQPNPRP